MSVENKRKYNITDWPGLVWSGLASLLSPISDFPNKNVNPGGGGGGGGCIVYIVNITYIIQTLGTDTSCIIVSYANFPFSCPIMTV